MTSTMHLTYCGISVQYWPRVFRAQDYGMSGDHRRGYLIKRTDNDRLLGHVIRDERTGRWSAYVSDAAFRGDGADDPGYLLDDVPRTLLHRTADGFSELSARTRNAAADLLLEVLRAQRAPGAGFGRHPRVIRAWEDDPQRREQVIAHDRERERYARERERALTRSRSSR